MLAKRVTGSQGVGLGMVLAAVMLIFGVGIYYLFRRTKRARLQKTQSAASAETTPSTDPRYNDSSAVEMGSAEENTCELSTRHNVHELAVPDRLHEMGDLAPEYGAEGDTHLEGDVGASDDVEGTETDFYPRGDNGKYDDGGGGGDELKCRASTKHLAELQGDAAFPEKRGLGAAEMQKEGVGNGFVLTD